MLQTHCAKLLARGIEALESLSQAEEAAVRAIKARASDGVPGAGASVLEQLLQVSSMHKDDTELLVQVSRLLRSVGQPMPPTLLRHLPIGAVSESADTPVADRLIASASLLA